MNNLLAEDAEADRLERWSLLASAICGRAVDVAATEPGELAWTDGNTIFLDPERATRDQREGLAVQASLIAAHSLQPGIVRRLKRRPALARRYLAVEAHRALRANVDWLPPVMRPLIDADIAIRCDSPTASLTAARHEQVAEPPSSFGTIRPRNLLAAKQRGDEPQRQRGGSHTRALDELDDDTFDENGQDFSSPVGGGGAIGRLLQKMLSAVRQLREGGPPGADAPTHQTRSGARGGVVAVYSTDQSDSDDDGDERDGTMYPEWDVHRRRYRPHWCTVCEVEPHPKADDSAMGLAEAHGLRRPLARLGMGLERCHRQAQGDDIDIDAAVEARVAALAGSAPGEAAYLDSVRRRRDLSVLVLLDISGSAAEPGADGQTVHEQQRAIAAALTVALHDLGDRVALYAFHSQGRSNVQLTAVKRFDDDVDTSTMRRLRSLTPGGYSRLGAAIRHGTSVLERRGGTSRRLLVVLSDGLAYDHGYERVYGAADARQALAEARGRGTGCLCLTVGASTDADELRRVFGTAAHATVPRVEHLYQMIGPLFRTALNSAETRQRTGIREKGNNA